MDYLSGEPTGPSSSDKKIAYATERYKYFSDERMNLRAKGEELTDVQVDEIKSLIKQVQDVRPYLMDEEVNISKLRSYLNNLSRWHGVIYDLMSLITTIEDQSAPGSLLNRIEQNRAV